MEEMTFDELCKYRTKLKSELLSAKSKLEIVDQEIKCRYPATCSICGTLESARNDIPPGWGWLVDKKYPILMCKKCIEKWEDRWIICSITRGESI